MGGRLVNLTEKGLETIAQATLRNTREIGFNHAQKNLIYIKKTIKDLEQEIKDEPPKPALVISAGPSLHRRKSLEAISQTGFAGHTVAVDGSLGHCLRNGVVPEYVITVDPDPHRIIRWFGDPRLEERPEDDYFRRQDLDPALNTDEVARNNELIELVNYYGHMIKVIISSSVSPEIAQRCLEANMDLYWWNPIYDDFDNSNSLTRKIYKLNGAPCMVTGGNVGTSAWVFSHTILKSPLVFMVGMDFSYPPDTKVMNTQYYEVLKDIYPDNPESGLIKIYNPFLNETWITDPAYYWYNHNFLKIAPKARCKTYNCTEGGILFGEGVGFIKPSEITTVIKEMTL
jgi:hypothetical protein